jgi:hypothetical protein
VRENDDEVVEFCARALTKTKIFRSKSAGGSSEEIFDENTAHSASGKCVAELEFSHVAALFRTRTVTKKIKRKLKLTNRQFDKK